jgi:hypothetical protein
MRKSEEHTKRRNRIDERARRRLQLRKTINRNAAATPAASSIVLRRAKTDGTRHADRKRIPRFARKWKREVAQYDLRIRNRRAELRIPLERDILGAIARAIGRKTQCASHQVEHIRLAERAVVQRHYNQIALRADRADGAPRLLSRLRRRDAERQRDENN